MKYDIGIDLGTTFSVIAVKGNVTLDSGYRPGKYLPYCDVTIIPTPDGDDTFPSVFWDDPNDPSITLVGVEAKQKAEEGDAPIMFSKRWIGTNQAMKMHDREYTALEVATHILKYLKKCAELALGSRITRAVVTHPAYFDPNQIQETRQAAIAAGFDMSLPQQLMMEPAAAALSFTIGIEKDPLRVLTYDLGGGTFDVTVLEKNQSLIMMKAFDGDHLLGGYNFDRSLVEWIIQRQREKGRVIPYDETNPDHRGRRARLLQLAEGVKMKLSEQRNNKVAVDVRAQDILIDADGKKVQVLEKINREQYAALIKDELDKTIRCCNSALAKAQMTIEDIDYILLVGGSTYGQWVAEAVAAAFGTERLEIDHEYDKDLCVGAGAAICAATLPTTMDGGASDGPRLVLDVAPMSSLPRVSIPGVIAMPDKTTLKPADLRIVLTPPNGVPLGQPVGADGKFLFEDVYLLEDDPTEFDIQVTDAAGKALLRSSFTMTYSAEEGSGVSIFNVLPKTIYLNSADGKKKIADDGVPLPARRVITATKVHDDASISIDILQEDVVIYTIDAGDLAKDAPSGSKIVITVEITQKNEMTGNIIVKTPKGATLGPKQIHFAFPAISLPDLSHLRASFEELDNKRSELEVLSPDPEHRMLLAGKGAKISRRIVKKFEEMEPDKQEIVAELKELQLLVYPPPDDMTPPKSQFLATIEACQGMLAAKQSEPSTVPLQQMLAKLETQGNTAAAAKDQKKWATINDSLENLYTRIKKLSGEDSKPQKQTLPPTPVLKQQGIQRVDQIRVMAKRKREACENDPKLQSRMAPRLEKIEKSLDQLTASIEKVDDDLDPDQALAQIQSALSQIPQIERSIDRANVDVEISSLQQN